MSKSSLDNVFPAPDSPLSTTASTATSRSAPSHNRNAQPARSPVSPLSSPTYDSFPRPGQQPAQPPTDRARLPKKAYDNPARNEIRDAVTRDALKEQYPEKVISGGNPPRLASLSNSSPLPSPTMSFSSSAENLEHRINMQRNASIDSTSSLLSSGTANSTRAGALTAYRASPDSGPVDITALIAAAGSPEAAVQKLLNEKQQTTSHNAQLWRLVEKQRAMILGLNKDLEKSLKEKERYRKKLKDYLAQAGTHTAPAASTGREVLERENSQSPAQTYPATSVAHPPVKEAVTNARKVSDASSGPSIDPGRSDTPQDSVAISLSAFPATPQSGSSDRSLRLATKQIGEIRTKPEGTPPTSPKGTHVDHKQADSLTLPNSPLRSPQSISSPKQANRKAPPAPLQLSPPPVTVTNNIIDPSDSEYEDDQVAIAKAEEARGRRKTREDDDRERELATMQDAEHRSRSKKEKSKSKSKAPEQSIQETPLIVAEPAKMSVPQENDDPTTILRRTQARGLQQHATAPALLSPGLPMSPRPGDRPMNSPMPRAPHGSLNAMPMSPKSGVAGLPLSPRAPRQPLPLPPQTPTGFASPHLARAEAYHQQAQAQQGSIADRLNEPAADKEMSTTKAPGLIYSELVSEQYPDLLLPPNALPSIVVKTSSSRMRPSRLSYIAPKHPDDNPVMTLAVHQRSDNKQMWRVEKTLASLAVLDAQVKAACTFRDRLPDKALFAGHAPARIDARRSAIDAYFDSMLESLTDERSASIVCKFLSTDAITEDVSSEYFPGAPMPEARPDTPVNRAQRPQLAGYLTKRGKNFGGWKARYFVLDGPSLRYFEAPGGAHLGSIRLQNAQIGKQAQSNTSQHEDEDNQFRHAFLILEPKKKDSSSLVRHVLCAESDEERDNWVNALLQYVDMKDDEETQSRPLNPGIKVDTAVPRSPRLQKSNSDLKSRDMLRAVNYDQVTAGDAPTMGVTGGKPDSPSPSPSSEGAPSTHPSISAPKNLTVISNTESWGMKPPPTPTLKEPAKDKKRSMFSAFRGRSSSDLAPEKGPGGHYSSDSQSHGPRAVFGIPLAEAANYVRPAGVTTELPVVVYRCLEYLTVKNAIAEEGIFRLSGSNTVMKALKDRFNAEGDVDLAHDNNWYDPHAIAGVLKLYLRELPASILTRELHLDFLPCLELNHKDKVTALNILVNKLPICNRALLDALTGFLQITVNNANVNKMNTRNVGIVFSPTLAIPAPLISALVEDQATIFGPPIDESEWPSFPAKNAGETDDLRSPRKQMFTDLPTPAYNQTTFQSFGGPSPNQDLEYQNYQVAPQGEGGFASLNDALRAPSFHNATSNGVASSRDVKARRRESGVMLLSSHTPQKKTSQSRLRDEDSTP